MSVRPIFIHCAPTIFVRLAVPRLFAIQGIFTTAITISLNLLFLLGFAMKVTGYVLSVVLADAIVGVAMFYCCGLWERISLRAVTRTQLSQMLRYSVPLIPTTIFWWITNVSDRYMIAWFCGDDINGLYAAAFKIPTLLILVSGIFIEAWHFSAVTERGDGQQAQFFSVVFDSFQAIMFMACAGLTAFAKVAPFSCLTTATIPRGNICLSCFWPPSFPAWLPLWAVSTLLKRRASILSTLHSSARWSMFC